MIRVQKSNMHGLKDSLVFSLQSFGIVFDVVTTVVLEVCPTTIYKLGPDTC